jgi:hypothetical protein
MSTRSTTIFKDPNVAKHLSLLHDKYEIVSTEKTPNDIVFVTALKLCTIREVDQHYLYVNIYVYFKFPA